MSHWIIAPIVLPALLAPILAFAMRHDRVLQRSFGLAGTVLLLMLAVGLAIHAFSGQITVYRLGDWPAPFGIVLVLDRLAAVMLLLTAVLGLAVQLYAIGSGWDKRGWHFHALFQFQLMGVNGAFLTGDAFNLFVFFEVLLIASYGLMIHGGSGPRLRAGLQYVVMNLAGSVLFLFALGTLYAITGTLNMADMALRMAELPPGDQAIAMVGAVLLLIVFAVKAAAFPVQFWLPATYANAAPPVAALFAIMTKVGAYAILRMYTLVFGPDLPVLGAFMSQLLMPAALITLIIGAVGVLGTQRLPRLAAYGVLASMGTLLVAIAPFTQVSLSAALFYMLHSTLAAGALFLVVDLIAQGRGRAGTGLPGGLTAAFYFAAAIALAGMPPLSGFVGKLLVLDAVRDETLRGLIWGVVLVSSLLVIVGMVRMGSALLWLPSAEEGAAPAAQPAPLALVAVAIPLGLIVALTLGAGPVTRLMEATAAQILSPQAYIGAVLRPVEGG